MAAVGLLSVSLISGTMRPEIPFMLALTVLGALAFDVMTDAMRRCLSEQSIGPIPRSDGHSRRGRASFTQGARMATFHFHQTMTSTPEQFIAGLTDFGPGRSKLFGNSA